AADFGEWLAAANLTGEASPAERAPDKRADFLVDGERHEFPLVLAAHERVINLVGYIASPTVTLAHGERLHEVPSGKIGAGDVTDLAGADECVEGVQGFLDRSDRVKAVHVVDVDVIHSEALQVFVFRLG